MTASGRLVDYMKAVRIHEFGGPETLKHEDVQLPAPAAGEVLVHACASGVNPVDWKVRAGYLKLALCSLAITVCNFAHVLRPRGITARPYRLTGGLCRITQIEFVFLRRRLTVKKLDSNAPCLKRPMTWRISSVEQGSRAATDGEGESTKRKAGARTLYKSLKLVPSRGLEPSL
jgi:hypothetical protein